MSEEQESVTGPETEGPHELLIVFWRIVAVARCTQTSHHPPSVKRNLVLLQVWNASTNFGACWRMAPCKPTQAGKSLQDGMASSGKSAMMTLKAESNLESAKRSWAFRSMMTAACCTMRFPKGYVKKPTANSSLDRESFMSKSKAFFTSEGLTAMSKRIRRYTTKQEARWLGNPPSSKSGRFDCAAISRRHGHQNDQPNTSSPSAKTGRPLTVVEGCSMNKLRKL
jgi:hypothetical protein